MKDERKAKTKSPFARGVVKVKVLDPATRSLRGEYMHLDLGRARKGEAKGFWQILPDQEPM